MTARTPQRQQLIELIGPVIAATGYDLDDLSVTAAGRRSLIRISVDGDQGIDLDAVATISRTISDVLDGDDGATFAGPYVLEVSSPGVDRPLTEPRHWRRATGRLVAVEVDGRPLTGRIVSADDSTVLLDLDGEQRSLPMGSLGRGRVQVEFSRPGEPEAEAEGWEADDTEADEADATEADATEADEADDTEADEAEFDDAEGRGGRAGQNSDPRRNYPKEA